MEKNQDEDEDEDEEDEFDVKKMGGQLGLTDASCQRPWREQTPAAAGERAMTSILLMSSFIILSSNNIIYHQYDDHS